MNLLNDKVISSEETKCRGKQKITGKLSHICMPWSKIARARHTHSWDTHRVEFEWSSNRFNRKKAMYTNKLNSLFVQFRVVIALQRYEMQLNGHCDPEWNCTLTNNHLRLSLNRPIFFVFKLADQIIHRGELVSGSADMHDQAHSLALEKMKA